MKRKFVLLMATVCVLAFAASAVAAPPPFGAKWKIQYDAYLDMTYSGGIKQTLADTLIVVNNPSDTKAMPVWIEVFDKYGTAINSGQLHNGTGPEASIPPNGFLWITIGMLVNQSTHDPWDFAGGQKFVFRISNGNANPPIVEVKQVIYVTRQNDGLYPGDGIPGEHISAWKHQDMGRDLPGRPEGTRHRQDPAQVQIMVGQTCTLVVSWEYWDRGEGRLFSLIPLLAEILSPDTVPSSDAAGDWL